jgi:DMSO/TMAO reductase YedYZ heme-binding membrane subunit
MKFRGFDARTQATRWGLFAVAIGIVVGATGPTAIAGLAGAWEANRSSLPWVFERTFAFLAYGALHQDLASFGVGLAAIHGMLLALDKSVPFSLAQIAVPGLAPYAPMWVAVGQVAFYLMAAVLASFYLRRRIGQRAWRLFHYLTFFAFIGATAHGLGAGTDSASPWAWWLYVGSSVVVVFLFVYRVASAVAGRSARPARTTERIGTA